MEETKTIDDKPRIIGLNKRCYPRENSIPAIATTVVLVEGDIGDYAAYVGHGPPEFVARFGNKISFEEACAHFPGGQLNRELYRD